MSRTIIISDIHGCFNTLQELLHTISYTAQDHLVVLGDLTDRGPRSKEVLDLFLSIQQKGYPLTLLRGNHEVMLMDALRDRELEPRWIRAGGDTTLKSLGINTVRDIPIRYIQMIHHMLDYYEDEDAIYVHAALNFSIADPFSDIEFMHWQREMIVDPVKTGGRPVIHGHTPLLLTSIEELIRNREKRHEINVDNGCVFNKEGMNQLLAYFPKTNHFVVQKNSD
ncbi:MAG: putative metallophosphoesterase [Chitinophagaceae bacterium]|nr:putative metallophosphoesterase [Chitinophagaceae bacterium]